MTGRELIRPVNQWEVSMKIRLGEVEKLAKILGTGFIEGPSCCPDDG
jgi:hypothetical protein